MPRDGDLRRIFKKHLPHFDWQSIETGGTGRGVPDSNYCYNGTEGWIEFKQTKAWAVRLRPEQVGWLSRRTRHQGRTWIGVRRQNKSVDELWLIPGGEAATLKLVGLKSLPGWCWAGGPGHGWDWRVIEKVLLV